MVRGTVAAASSQSSEAAPDLARSAREQFGASVGVGLRATIAPATQGLYEGTIDVVVSGECVGDESFPIRAAFQEIQRRAALHAADVLRRGLAGI